MKTVKDIYDITSYSKVILKNITDDYFTQVMNTFNSAINKIECPKPYQKSSFIVNHSIFQQYTDDNILNLISYYNQKDSTEVIEIPCFFDPCNIVHEFMSNKSQKPSTILNEKAILNNITKSNTFDIPMFYSFKRKLKSKRLFKKDEVLLFYLTIKEDIHKYTTLYDKMHFVAPLGNDDRFYIGITQYDRKLLKLLKLHKIFPQKVSSIQVFRTPFRPNNYQDPLNANEYFEHIQHIFSDFLDYDIPSDCKFL